MESTLTKKDIESGRVGKNALFDIYLETVTKISKIPAGKLSVKVAIDFGVEHQGFSITIFDGTKENENRSFFFLDFLYMANMMRTLAQAIALIKADDFDNVKLFFDGE